MPKRLAVLALADAENRDGVSAGIDRLDRAADVLSVYMDLRDRRAVGGQMQHHAGPRTDPDEDGVVSEDSVSRLSAWVKERFPGADPEPLFAETCLYTNTDDERFILERHGRIVVGSPCSGHGFKFAPFIGQRLADLAGAAP